jgi:aryl-alcohol dehydrogenase-like predicted oxidoreductase
VLDLGITLIDTAPAYGSSEQRIGNFLHNRREEYNLCTKVGENTVDGKSVFDFSKDGMRKSVEQSLQTLQTDCVDILLIHAPPDDLSALHETDAIEMMHAFKQEGKTKSIGFSGKTTQAQQDSLDWSDVVMIEYNATNTTNETIIKLANEKNILVLLKKALNSGHLPSHEAIEFLTKKSPLSDKLDCTVIGSTSVERMKENVEAFTL